MPDSGRQGMQLLQGFAPTEYGYSGVGDLYKLIDAPSPLVGTPQTFLRSSSPTGGQAFLGTTGSGTDSHIYVLDGVWPAGAWTDRLVAGAADAEWFFVQFGDNTLAAGGTGIRLKVHTPAVPGFTNVASNVSPKFACIFGDRAFVANLSWNIAGITTTATTGTEADYIFASNHNDVGTFGDPSSTAGLGAMIFILRDEYGPITGLAATQSYILVCKERALIIGRRTTTYDIDWNYLGPRFGCNMPRSIVVDGEDVYLWSTSGPICVVGGREIKQIGLGRVSNSLISPFSDLGTRLRLGVTATGGSTYYPIYGTQDVVSGIVNWHFSPGTDTLGVASMELDTMIHFDPNTDKLSHTYCDTAVILNGAVTDLDYKAAASARVVPTNLDGMSPIGNIVFVRSNGQVWSHKQKSGVIAGTTQALTEDPFFRTPWFAGDDGGNFRIAGVYFEFQSYADFGVVSVTIDGIADRGSGTSSTWGPFTGVDLQGRIDTSNSPEWQMARITVTFGKTTTTVKNGAQNVRNISLFEVAIEPTTNQGAF